ncbi:MAG: hypothetical protein D6796_08005 [Caldilineae bacterium]|nr:MAG: hypothetical protein D6796_08005 [Caldilineae bacterium]
MPDQPDYTDIEDFIRQVFEENFEQLRLESGHSITPEVKEAALQQVLLYWRKLHHIAERVTDTEVHLSLPGQETPRGREYTIEGVVDIVREEGRVTMYDIKTHDADYVRANLELYEQQLNVYAHIWQELRRQPLDEAAVIATDFPRAVKEALESNDPNHLAYALAQWDPIVPITYDPARKDRTLYEFGQVVDQIEDGQFAPPPVEKLEETIPGPRTERFGTRVCRNCDARFSCDSYRRYAWGSSRGRVAESRMPYFADTSDDLDQETWRTAGLDASV